MEGAISAVSPLFGTGKLFGTSDLPRPFFLQFHCSSRIQVHMEISISNILALVLPSQSCPVGFMLWAGLYGPRVPASSQALEPRLGPESPPPHSFRFPPK